MAMKTVNSDELFGLVSRVFGSAMGHPWATALDRPESVARAFLVPAVANRSIEMSPIHQRHAIREFIHDHPLALEQLVELIDITTSIVGSDRLSIGEVRFSTDIDGEDILGLYLRLKLSAEEFTSVRSQIRQKYRQDFPDGCQLVVPMVLRLDE